MGVKEKVSLFFEQYPTRTYEKHDLLLHPEEPVPAIFYLLEGRVSQYDIAPNGNEIVVNVFKPGAFFPMSSAVNDVVNLYFFEPSIKTVVRVAPKEDVIRFLHQNPDVVFDLLARVYRGVDGVLRRMAHLMGGDAQSRLIFELLNAAHRFGVHQSDAMLLPLSESDLAKYSGLARETVSRLLQELKSANLIEVSRNGVTIKSVSDLEARLGSAL